MDEEKSARLTRIIVSILSVLIVAAFCMLFIKTDTHWYEFLVKPAIMPAPLVFGLISAGVMLSDAAAVILLSLKKSAGPRAYVYLISSGVLSILWCVVFYTLHIPVVSALIILLNIIALYLAILKTISINRLSGLLLIPNLGWLIYLLLLNYLIALFN